jgi:hypothetical protein
VFFRKFNPGQFCQLSVFGKGDHLSVWHQPLGKGDFVRFTVQKMAR